MAMTNADVKRLSGTREIQNADTVDWKQGLKPRKGGLFDEGLTGGHNGTRWSHIKLHEPMLNPVMEEPTRILLGLTKPKFVKIMKGDDEFQGARGPGAIAGALKRLDITKEISRARADIKSGRKTYRDSAVRRLRYLKAAKKTKLHPGEWTLDKVPVLPPIFRPITTMMGSDMRIVSDSNYLYKELFDSNKNLKELSSKVADVGDERIALYNSFKAVVGLGDPLGSELRDRKVKGLLAHIFGSSPKYGVVQRRLLGSTVDVVGRAAITPNPDLDMDEVALPEDKAWDVYRPFTIRHLVRKGMPRLQAARIVKDRTDAARKALLDVMKDRPIIYNRAPVLHRYGMMAAFPRLTKGDTMQVSPLIVGGFGADFDGDAMQYHVPVSEEARREAIDKMLPSRNLLSAAHFDVHFKPSQEYLGGLYSASSRVDRKRPARTFETRGDAIRAYRRGEIGVGQRITILK
jgi:DNA-directed RNA polymerase subunit beta'